MKSLKESKAVDNDGNLIPWMNYPIINLLKDRLTSDLNLFEFGSGYSTLFYARLVKSVTSVEYDDVWLQIVKKTLPNNVKLIYKEKDIDGDYCRVINSTGQQYDFVVVDGRDRVNCIKQSIKALSPRGVILLDDSQKTKYREGIQYAKECNFRSLDFEGLKPTHFGVDRATLFYRDNNCLGI